MPKVLRYGLCVTTGSQFYLSLTHEPYLPLLTSCKTSSFWYSLRLSTTETEYAYLIKHNAKETICDGVVFNVENNVSL